MDNLGGEGVRHMWQHAGMERSRISLTGLLSTGA